MAVPVFLICFACQNESVTPGFSAGGQQDGMPPRHVTTVKQADISRVYEAVGTIRPLTESVIEAQVSAQVLSVFPVPGTVVKKNQVLIELDARRLKTRLKQAGEGLSVARTRLAQARKGTDEARAGLDQAEAAYTRTKKLFKSDIVPSQKLEMDKSAFLQAKARLEKAQEAVQTAKSSIRKAEEVVQEANIALGYARITSPADGIVAERMADPGDLALPGKPLLVIQTSGSLRLEANVREGLISRIELEKTFPVKIETIGKTVSSRIEEIVPYADPETRTFLVKASLPDAKGIFPGMFGRLLIPVEKERTLLVPVKAVRKVGQLELIYVKDKDNWQSVYIKTGKTIDDQIEVLAGLSVNETIGYND